MRLRDSGAGRRGPGGLGIAAGEDAAIVARSRPSRRFGPQKRIRSPEAYPTLAFAGTASRSLPGLGSAGDLPYVNVLGRDTGSWPQIFASIGFQQHADAHVFVARAGAAATSDWPGRIEKGAILVLEGESPLAESLGFKRGKGTVHTTSLRDVHRPALPIIWEKALELPVMDLPAGATVFARERWTGAPMTAGVRRGCRRGLVGCGGAGGARVRAVPIYPRGAHGSGPRSAFSGVAAVGVLRFVVSLACRFGLLRGALAQIGHRGAACGGVALLRARRGARRISAKAYRGVPSRGDSGLRVARVAACEREVLGRSPGVAREDGRSAGRAARLAQADEPDESRLFSRGVGRREGIDFDVRLGWRQPRRVVF